MRSLFAFWMGGGCALPYAPPVPPAPPPSLDRIFRTFSGGSADIFRTAANAGGAKSIFRTYSGGATLVFRLNAFSFIDEVISIDTLSDIDTLQGN